MEFTGDYYKCKYCGHMWDYMDICPNCSEDKMNTLNANEVKEEANRLLKMLEAHGDYSPNEAKAALPLQRVMAMLPDPMKQNQAALDYAEKRNNPDFFLVKQVYKDGINYITNLLTKKLRGN